MILKFSSKIKELNFNRKNLGQWQGIVQHFDKEPDKNKSISDFVHQSKELKSFKKNLIKMIETTINKLTKIIRKLLNCQLPCVFYWMRSKKWCINCTDGNESIELKKEGNKVLNKIEFLHDSKK